MSTGSRALGAAGEELAADHYRRLGYEVLDRNWRCADGELDLVCRRWPVVVVCEVKTRRSRRFGPPEEAVTRAKQRRIRRLAARWLAEHPVAHRVVRFDVAAVEGGEVRLVEAAF